ncbi:MAG: DUF4332 domain-containing protein [Pseudomonadota bacterium]
MEAHLHTVITAHYCRSTHHFIVMDALERIGGPNAEGWRRLLLHEHKALLKGAKAPDAEFKDFKNHVLHVGGEREWGGARGAATEWYNRSVAALSAKRWRDAAYALGVLSHYYADPIQPFHTGQTEAEGAVHRALEWSIFKSRPALKARMAASKEVAIRGSDDTNFVSDMVGAGARASHVHYSTFIDHYNLDTGKKTPEAGLDDTLLNTTASLLQHAVSGVTHLYERAFAEARVAPKSVRLSLDVVVAQIGKPLRKILSKIEDAGTRRAVEAAYDEYKRTGKVVEELSDDDAAIRALHAREVRNISLEELDAEPPASIGSRHGMALTLAKPEQPAKRVETPEPAAKKRTALSTRNRPNRERARTPTLDRVLRELSPERRSQSVPPVPVEQPNAVEQTTPTEASDTPPAKAPGADRTSPETPNPRSGLNLDSPVVDAPSIGKRTARHLRRAEITTIGELLAAEPATVAEIINQRHISGQTILDWQDQTRLKMALPSLRVHDVQILVGSGIRDVDALKTASATSLFEAAILFARTPAAERIIHDADKPTRDEVDGWISKANAKTG